MSEDDLRSFIEEITRRHERTTEAVIGHLDQQRLALVDMRDTLVDMRLEIADQRKQIQANTQAVLSVLDRLN